MPAAATPKKRHTFSRHVAPLAPVALALLMQSASTGGRGGVATNTTAPEPASVSVPAESGFIESCPNPLFPSPDQTTIDQTSCTIAGSGGAETFQNEAKNNFCAVGPAKPKTISDLVSLQAKVEQDVTIPFGNTRSHGTHPHGPATDRKPLQDLGEGTLVTLQGFVLIARQEGAESVNCGMNVADVPSNHDIHISIVAAPGQDECSGVVAEMIPHHRPADWTEQSVNAVGSKKLPVRLTGQLFFDSSHSPCQNGVPSSGDPQRIALWEVHPIYDFEVCTQGDCSDGKGWETLDQFVSSNK